MHTENELDQYIFENSKLQFIVKYRELHNCDLKTALEELGRRFRLLKTQFPDKLPSEDEFFKDFYT